MRQLDTDKILEQLKQSITQDKLQIAALQEENDRLRSELFKHAHFISATQEDDMPSPNVMRGFIIDETEAAQIKTWIAQHECDVHGIKTDQEAEQFHGSIGGNYTYSFVPTSIGILGRIKCSACGAELTFKDM